MSDPLDRDEAAIRDLIGAHFEGMRWDSGRDADWARFTADFLEGATLYPAARPVAPKTVEAFVARMNAVAANGLETFEEHTSGMHILRFGNVAVVLALSWMLENGHEENEDVSAYLLVKTDGAWKIAAHAWDKVTDRDAVPTELRG